MGSTDRSPSPTRQIPAPLLVLAAVVSVQFGGAFAATLVPEIGAAGSVFIRLLFATALLLVIVRPRWRGHSRSAWIAVTSLGVALGLMNFAFYASLAHLPIGVAVTIEFLGPLLLAAALSRRAADFLAVLAAAAGVLLISEAATMPLADLNWTGFALAAAAGACWAAYIVCSGRTGVEFDRLDGLALAMVVATVMMAPFGVGSMSEWDASVLVRGLGIAVMSSVMPYSLEMMALRRMRAQVFGILLSLEPVVAALAGLIVLGQALTGTQLIGMSLVVLAAATVLGFGNRETVAEAATSSKVRAARSQSPVGRRGSSTDWQAR